MKTTLRARFMRTYCIGVIGVSIIMMVIGVSGAYQVAKYAGKRLGEYAVNTCSICIESECDFLAEHLAEAEISDNGDVTFEKISLYNNFDENSIVSSLSAGQLTILSADTTGRVTVVMNRGSDIIAGELSADYFNVYVESMSNDDGLGMICTQDGTVIMSSDTGIAVPGQNVSNYGLAEAFANASSGITDTIENVVSDITNSGSSMVTYSPIADTGLVVLFAEDFNEIYMRVNILLIGMAIFTIIFIITATIIASGVSKKISKSVVDVTDRIVKLADGDLSSECIKNRRGDETQILEDSMKRTIDSLSFYINDIGRVLSELCQGNLNVRSSVEYTGDFVDIKRSLDGICKEMRSTMSDIGQAGDEVFRSSNLLSEKAKMLSDNAATEADSLETINSMTSNIGMRVSHNNETTTKATELLDNIVDIVTKGNTTMDQMAAAMDEIQKTSDEIQSIVKTIDDISFQTNILALNAAIEAARAGDAGKGFSIVADEVKNLAGKSSKAAQNTMQLVERSGIAVEKGSVLTAETSEAFRTINQSVNEFTDLMSSIAGSSKEQGEAISQITERLVNITQIVQANTATAEESTESSQELKTQADILNSKVSSFQI